ncbi:MAG TPA: hypothetical protein DCY79_19825 [Planctomycetaceae bacterium]|nr:hypothetical protein [Blastopirellula sp.]HAY82060.1 hypothetical protein [Planctomycetaceae bacterium]
MKKIKPYLLGFTLLAACASIAFLLNGWLQKPRLGARGPATGDASTEGDQEGSQDQATGAAPEVSNAASFRVFPKGEPGREKLFFWWDEMVEGAKRVSFATGPESNIHPDDYVGSDACQKCHKKNHQQWSEHPHRWMNAVASNETVKGDFSEQAQIQYLQGTANFSQTDENYRMRLERDGRVLEYAVEQTLGSRFFQYYIGRLVTGGFPEEHPYRQEQHVLPFGFWIEKNEWVPIVHVGPELPDGKRFDPFAPPEQIMRGVNFLPYARYCNVCHTTFPLGDNLFRKTYTLAKHAPGIMHIDMPGYIEDFHQELWDAGMTRESATPEQIERIPSTLANYEASKHAVSLGISCEACHFGCDEHVKNPKKLPSFAPRSEHLRIENGKQQLETGKTHANLNWACARCHTGDRPRFAAGMSTWNSTEYSDAMLGHCYSQLKCIDCHAPHQATGLKWSHTPAEDDAKCMKCHQQYEDEKALVAHTHHPAGTSGSRCMNCHMPKINEGLQDVVRTHTIFSPTQKDMIEKNHLNACNLCHTEQPIDWTLTHLKEWYGTSFDEAKLAAAYPARTQAVGLGWLASENEAVRLVTLGAMRENLDAFAAAELIEALDDPFLLNRQFARLAVEALFAIELEDYGYQFYMTPDERREPLAKLRSALQAGDLQAVAPAAQPAD